MDKQRAITAAEAQNADRAPVAVRKKTAPCEQIRYVRECVIQTILHVSTGCFFRIGALVYEKVQSHGVSLEKHHEKWCSYSVKQCFSG